MNYTYQVITPQDIVLGINRIEVEYNVNTDSGSGVIGCNIGYTLTIYDDPSQPNRSTYIFRTCIITSNQIACDNDSINTSSVTSVNLNFISSIGSTIVSIRIEDNFSLVQNYCLTIVFIVINNSFMQEIEDVIIDEYSPEDIIDYVRRPTSLGSYDKNRLLRGYHERVSTAPVRYTNSISDVVSNCNFVPYLAVQDRYFVINYEGNETSEYAVVNLGNVRISGWTDRDIYFFEKVYADVSDPDTIITDEMGLLEPLVDDPYNSTQPFTLVHNMYPLSIHRNGEIVVYNNQTKDFPYITSLFYTANVSQIRYERKVYKPLTPYMYYRTIAEIGKPTKIELVYSYLNRFNVVRTYLQSLKDLLGDTISIGTVTRNLLLPIDYNILFYLESHWNRLLGDESSRIFVKNHNDEAVEYPVIIQMGGDNNQHYSLVIFRRDSGNSVTLSKDRDVGMSFIPWEAPLSFFAGGGLLGWGAHKPGGEDSLSIYYLFSWYKILRTKRLTSSTSTPMQDDYLRYYYYYQHII